MGVHENIQQLKKEIPEGVTLVAVSKTKPNEQILEAYNIGHRDFGENYVQELLTKQKELPQDIRWHFIGHLQSNKVKNIAPFVSLIHGVDSLKLLQEIDRQGQKNNRIIDCLLQIHVAREETKFGFSFVECEDLLNSGMLSQLKHVNVKGFMAMASNTDNEEQIRQEFRALKNFSEKISGPSSIFHFPLPIILSFGMSSDYRLALEEGSTMLRIGSTIFGERAYPVK